MVFRRIEPGPFTMGSPEDEHDRESQEVRHAVVLTRAFWLGAYEVTQDEWSRVMGSQPSWFAGKGRHPVENVTLHDVQRFLERLEALSAGHHFRLPTEAEWEYACRAGTNSAYSVGETLSVTGANIAPTPELAAAGSTTAVGAFAPNAWGLYDMHGNVWEWTDDEHCPYTVTGATTDPHLRCGSSLHVIRGGSWRFGADSARCALRYTHRPQDKGYSLGFRVVRDVRNTPQ